jgi:hypothetical protein
MCHQGIGAELRVQARSFWAATKEKKKEERKKNNRVTV